jgi:hypothetical protein
MVNEQLLSGDMDIKVRPAISGKGIIILFVGKESGLSLLLSEDQASRLKEQLVEKTELVEI